LLHHFIKLEDLKLVPSSGLLLKLIEVLPIDKDEFSLHGNAFDSGGILSVADHILLTDQVARTDVAKSMLVNLLDRVFREKLVL
jgi:hypothetical protein